MVPWVTTNRPLCQVPVPRPWLRLPPIYTDPCLKWTFTTPECNTISELCITKGTVTSLIWNQFGPKIHKNHHSLYIENCLENIFVIHVKGNIERLLLPGNFEMSIIFFLLSFQFFLYKILSVEFETDLGYSLQMQNWNDQIKSKNDISI